MKTSSPACAPTDDADFGPIVSDDCRGGFDFTIFFEQSILVLVPAALLLLATPFRLVQLRKRRVLVAGRTLRLAKLVTTAAVAILQLTTVALWAGHLGPAPLDSVSIAASSVSFASSLTSCALSYLEHSRSLRPSSLLNVFLLLSLLLDGALLRSLWLSAYVDMPLKGVFTTALALKAILVVLEALGKTGYIVDGVDVRSPEETAGIYSRAVFAWVAPLFKTGFQKLLRPTDLYDLDDDLCTALLGERFQRHWARHQSSSSLGRRYRLIWTCILTLQRSLYAVIIPRLALLAFTICQPLVLNRFLIYLDDGDESVNIGYALIGAYGLVYLGIALSQALYWHRNGRSVTMLRGVLVSAIFAKSTELSIATADSRAPVTLMSSDVELIVRAVKQIHEFWATLIQIAIATWLLSIQIGYAASGPILVAMVALAATLLSTAPVKKSQKAWLGKTQKRIGTTSSLISHIKSIKILGLSNRLSETIASLRIEEIVASRPFRTCGAITSAVAQMPVMISPIVAFAMSQTFIVFDSTTLFATLSLILLLAQPLFWMFEVVIDLSAALAGFERIQGFLTSETRNEYREIGPTHIVRSSYTQETATGIEMVPLVNSSAPKSLAPTSVENAVEVSDASFAWSSDRKVLDNISFNIPRGQLVLVVGTVASGKTTLLKGLLGEVPTSTGVVRVQRVSMSWCEQSPWLLNRSVRDNIVGYAAFEQSLYDQITKACELMRDFEQLPDGDLTVVGSKGLAISGGQKQRIALARALYARPQLALFDDVFSGLDNTTSKSVFKNVFATGGLLRTWGTTVILATQTAVCLGASDAIITIKDGTISELGTYDQLRSAGGYLQTLVREKHHSTTGEEGRTQSPDASNVQATSRTTPKAPAPKVQNDQRRQLGDKTVYGYYFGTMGVPFLIALLLLEIGWAFLENFGSVWLNFWAAVNNNGSNEDTGYYLGVYAALQILGVIWFAGLIGFVLVVLAAKSGISLHDRLLRTVIKAPLQFFATTDLGAITTRFSQDIGMVDNQLPLALVVAIATFFGLIAKAGLLASSSYYVAIAYPFLGALYYYMQRGYLRTSRQLRLLDLEEKAPTYTHFLESIAGLSTIRAFGWTQAAIDENHRLVDRSQRPFYLLIMAQRSLVLVLDLTTTALAVILVGSAVAQGSVSVGLTGVALVQLISLSETVNTFLQFVTSLETSISAIARIKQFSEETPEEALPGESGLEEPPKEWPSQGHIVIEGLTASYGETGDIKALDHVDLEIRPGEKVGICGRTGSGKSSLMLAILRLLDPSSGSITIDSLPLTSVPRETLRNRIIAISQDQFVLPGTVRENIDPLHAATTETITWALSAVGILQAIEDRGGLDATFEEDMLSHGQKQLFFLARALLRRNKSKIVLFDEATSSVDMATEESVRKVIDTHFASHTVVSIAHRLDTIMEFDKLVVLDQGCVVEIGRPSELLQKGGRFRTLWDADHHES